MLFRFWILASVLWVLFCVVSILVFGATPNTQFYGIAWGVFGMWWFLYFGVHWVIKGRL